ncbi:hypothetical protein QR680_003702 [Steinernema hermaphroditum]|uniref:Uncharacterized protein n=1 Tax=Steinernema hermaphroditum TaxID=289476 RepID=A0AA39HMA6_9BILA|nr:hypothetical protein QR680_003702 [Steinernema hermaphroditum]
MYLSLVAYLIKLKISSKLPSSKAELRILLVAIICFICEALYVIFGYWILPETTLPDLTIVIVVNFAWMIECGLFAISTMAVNSRMDLLHVIIGIIYFVISTTLFTLNALMLVTLHRAKDLHSGPQTIIKCILICCMIQLVPFVVGGIMTIGDTEIHFYVDRILGVAVEAAWFPYISLSLALPVDRLLIFVASKRLVLRAHITRLLITVSWMIGVAAVIVLCLPDFGYTYNSPEGRFGWSFYRGRVGAAVLADIEIYYDLIAFGVILMAYLAALVYIVKYKSSFSSCSSNEVRVFIIALVSYIYEALFVAWSFVAPSLLRSRVSMRIVVNILWMLDAGMFALTTMVICKSMRKEMKKLFTKKANVVSIVKSYMSR